MFIVCMLVLVVRYRCSVDNGLNGWFGGNCSGVFLVWVVYSSWWYMKWCLVGILVGLRLLR